MSNSTIPGLPAVVTLSADAEVWINQGGVDYRTTAGQIALLVNGAQTEQTANTFFAGPTTGIPALPSFRAIVSADFPTAMDFTGKTITAGTYVGPTFTTPALGTPASGVLTNCTGLPISTGVAGLGAGIATFLTTPTSANLKAAVTDETGSGALVFATSPTLVTPVLGVASGTSLALSGPSSANGTLQVIGSSGNATDLVIGIYGDTPASGATLLFSVLRNGAATFTSSLAVTGALTAASINKVTITAPATAATLTIANNKTLTVSNTLTFAGTDSTTLTFQGTGTVVNRDSTDTLTNKTFDTAGAGNVLRINGTAVSAVSGTGAVVLASGPSVGTLSTTGTTTLGASSTDPTVINGKSITTPNKPLFAVYVHTTINNVTGNGADYLVKFDTKNFDQTTSFTIATGLFVAPVDGHYRFDSTLTLNNTVVGDTRATINLVVNSSTVYGRELGTLNPDSNTRCSGTINQLLNLVTNDTVAVHIAVTGSGADTVGIYGDSNGVQSFFSGYLVG